MALLISIGTIRSTEYRLVHCASATAAAAAAAKLDSEAANRFSLSRYSVRIMCNDIVCVAGKGICTPDSMHTIYVLGSGLKRARRERGWWLERDKTNGPNGDLKANHFYLGAADGREEGSFVYFCR